MVFIYILELEGSKYFIGKTNEEKFDIDEHFDASKFKWTSMHKPKRIIEIISNCNELDENKYTIIYMMEYGIRNVRGGKYNTVILDNNDLNILDKLINYYYNYNKEKVTLV